MNDKRDGDDKKRGRGFPAGERGRGPKGPPRSGEDRPRGTKPFRPRPERAGGETGERTDRPKRAFGGANGEKRPPRTDGEERGPRPAGARREGGGFAKREEGGFKKREGGFEKREGRPFEKREGRSFQKRDGKPFEKREGRPFEKREEAGFDKPRRERPRREDGAEEAGAGMRIAKRLARAGIASRRDAEAMIADGRVRLNGHLVETPAIVVKASDRIEIDGEPLPATERTRLWLFHKPAGLVTTNRDPEGRPTVFERLPEDLPRVMTVGRLDINTEGLLLLTNDGGLSRTLELPETGWLRRYRVRAYGTITQKALDELKHGIAVDGVFYGAIEAVLDSQTGHNVWMTLGLREGKNREVKRVLGHLGLEVNRLIRLSFGPFQLGDLPEGAVREIKGRTLRDQLGERLIEESGADFDAPIVNAFTNDVVEAGSKGRPEAAAEPAERRERTTAPRNEWVTSRGEAKKPSRKSFGDAKRESALARLDTKPRFEGRGRDGAKAEGSFRDKPRRDDGKAFGAGDKPFRPKRGEEAGSDERGARPKPATGRRNANVWIAPGGRPLSERQAAEQVERKERKERMERPGGGGDKPLRSRGFRDAPDGAARADGDKPRRSAGFRSQSAGKSFGEGREGGRGPKPGGFGKPGGGDRPRGRPGGGGGAGGAKRPPRGE